MRRPAGAIWTLCCYKWAVSMNNNVRQTHVRPEGQSAARAPVSASALKLTIKDSEAIHSKAEIASTFRGDG
ncbi:hypothetical protein B0H14DRAFT_3475771 [Mycena olivaceomarginata]|nr:hypothetical protein B0H14DRAFT_3475771 [Mycena olivaceomarginata]